MLNHTVPPPDSAIQAVVKQIFAHDSIRVERVAEGVSTWVYRLTFPQETWYLRVLPEEGASFAPEATVHTRLRQMQVKVPDIIHFEHCNDLLHRSLLVTREIKGQPLGSSSSLPQRTLEEITREAGRDLARLTTIQVEGFGWVRRDDAGSGPLRAEWPSNCAFLLEDWEADLAVLAEHGLARATLTLVEQVCSRYEAWLDSEQGYLAHGDFDTTHIYQDQGRYTGLIDFGEIRGTDRWYDLGHFHLRDGERLPVRLLTALVDGYSELVALPESADLHIRLRSLFINVHALARHLRKRPPDGYTRHQLQVLEEDLAVLL
jgi:aminoglycoside phosphotransferase (APT) family kinase protein